MGHATDKTLALSLGRGESPGPCLLFSTAKTGLGAGTPSRRPATESLDQTRFGFFQSIGIKKGKPFAPDERNEEDSNGSRRHK
jgi:hypothetical protein